MINLEMWRKCINIFTVSRPFFPIDVLTILLMIDGIETIVAPIRLNDNRAKMLYWFRVRGHRYAFFHSPRSVCCITIAIRFNWLPFTLSVSQVIE